MCICITQQVYTGVVYTGVVYTGVVYTGVVYTMMVYMTVIYNSGWIYYIPPSRIQQVYIYTIRICDTYIWCAYIQRSGIYNEYIYVKQQKPPLQFPFIIIIDLLLKCIYSYYIL